MVCQDKRSLIELVQAIHRHGYSVILIPFTENAKQDAVEPVPADRPPPMHEQLVRFLGQSQNGECHFDEWAEHLGMPRDRAAAMMRGTGKSHSGVQDKFFTLHWVFTNGKRTRLYRLTDAGREWLKHNPK